MMEVFNTCKQIKLKSLKCVEHMSGYRPPEKNEPLKPSETSKYFIKKGVKKVKNNNTYTKTDSEGRVLLFTKDHKFIRQIT